MNKRPRENEIQQAAAILRTFKPGYLPQALFEQYVRLMVSAILEVIPLRLTDREIEVLLFARPPSDPTWGGLLHTPGTVLRPTDSSLETALRRLCNDELGAVPASPTVFVGHRFHSQARGKELALIYWVEMRRAVASGTFFPVHNLPASLVPTQRAFIMDACQHFLHTKIAGNVT